MVNRGTDAMEVIERRMSMAEKRIKESVFYDYIVINDDLETAIDEVKSIILASRIENKNICNLESLIATVTEDK